MTQRTRRGWMLAATTLVALALVSFPAMAQRPGGPGEPGRGPEVGRLVMRHLDLSDAQRDAIRDLLRSRREAVDPEAVEAHRAARHEMVRLLWSPDATAEQVDAQATALAEFDRARAAKRFETTRLVLAELTPEQVAELQALIEDPPEPRARRGHGFRHGRRGGSGS